MKALSVKKRKNPIQRSIKNFMKTEDIGNQNKEIKNHISHDSAHTTLDRWSTLADEGDKYNFDHPISDDDFDMTQVLTDVTYQNNNKKSIHKPIFNMADLESVTELPAITPSEHESYQK